MKSLPLRRWWHSFLEWICGWYGHDYSQDQRVAVVPLVVQCDRCGRWIKLRLKR